MITPAAIAVELGRPAPSNGSKRYAQWDTWIADARMLIAERLVLADLDQVKLDFVVRKAVAAFVKRPDDATQVDIAVDDGRVSKRYTSGRGQIVILDEWWAMLDPGQGEAGAFSARPAFEPDRPVCWP